MNGLVDDQLRALLRLPVSNSRYGERTDLVVWIDTAFNGGLAIPRKQVAEYGHEGEKSGQVARTDRMKLKLARSSGGVT